MTSSTINPAVSAMLRSARDMLTHEHSLFKSMNLEPVMIGKGSSAFDVDLPAGFTGENGKIHGGLYSTIMDTIFGITVFTALSTLTPIATINLRSDFLASAEPGARARCTAKCLEIRETVAFVEGDLSLLDSNTTLAKGSGAFMIGTRGKEKGSRL